MIVILMLNTFFKEGHSHHVHRFSNNSIPVLLLCKCLGIIVIEGRHFIFFRIGVGFRLLQIIIRSHSHFFLCGGFVKSCKLTIKYVTCIQIKFCAAHVTRRWINDS